jgi:D-alanyl-D-alanine carboxypeptidase
MADTPNGQMRWRCRSLDGISGMTARIAQLQVQIAAMNPSTATRPAQSAAQNSFASVYADAVASVAAPASSVASGRLNAQGVPADLAVFGNGKAPDSALQTIGATGHRLWAPAASSLDSLLTAARRDGVQIGITDSYRSYDEQVDLVRRKGLYSQGGLAAQPGTSDHGWGRSVDLDLDARAQAWMRTNGKQYGFAEDVPREPWHWTFTPQT